MLQRTLPAGFVAPCLPSPAEDRRPARSGFTKSSTTAIECEGTGVRLLTRNGHDWAPRYPLIIEAVAALPARSCLIDGEAVAMTTA
jgi:bifunctional non-homologous end joining protein LigD